MGTNTTGLDSFSLAVSTASSESLLLHPRKNTPKTKVMRSCGFINCIGAIPYSRLSLRPSQYFVMLSFFKGLDRISLGQLIGTVSKYLQLVTFFSFFDNPNRLNTL